MSREFDFIIWGVTGYTGRLAALNLARRYGPPGDRYKYAIAARSLSKLENIEKEMQAEWKKRSSAGGVTTVTKITADVTNSTSMVNMCKRSKVLVALAGPYSQVGEAAVAACVEAGTHYVDITGETVWVKSMYTKYHNEAQRKGLKIVPCCGYDYVVSDIPILYATQYAAKQGGKEVLSVEQVNATKFSGMSSGTMASMIQMLAKTPLSELATGRLPYNMCSTTPESAVLVKKNKPKSFVGYSQKFKCYTNPDTMGMGMMQHFHWTNEVMEYPYGKNVVYQVAAKAPSVFSALGQVIQSQIMLISAVLMSRCPHRFTHAPGTGPAQTLDHTDKAVEIVTNVTVAAGETERDYAVKMTFNNDPYVFAAVAAVEAAIVLMEHGSHGVAGVLPPSGALGTDFCERLAHCGVNFEMVNQS